MKTGTLIAVFICIAGLALVSVCNANGLQSIPKPTTFPELRVSVPPPIKHPTKSLEEIFAEDYSMKEGNRILSKYLREHPGNIPRPQIDWYRGSLVAFLFLILYAYQKRNS